MGIKQGLAMRAALKHELPSVKIPHSSRRRRGGLRAAAGTYPDGAGRVPSTRQGRRVRAYGRALAVSAEEDKPGYRVLAHSLAGGLYEGVDLLKYRSRQL